MNDERSLITIFSNKELNDSVPQRHLLQCRPVALNLEWCSNLRMVGGKHFQHLFMKFLALIPLAHAFWFFFRRLGGYCGRRHSHRGSRSAANRRHGGSLSRRTVAFVYFFFVDFYRDDHRAKVICDILGHCLPNEDPGIFFS